jgi:hypothetical protein
VQIIHVNLTSTHPVPLVAGSQIAFTFAVNWLPTLTPFESRFERYLDYNFFEHKVGGAGTRGGALSLLPQFAHTEDRQLSVCPLRRGAVRFAPPGWAKDFGSGCCGLGPPQ